MEEVERSRKVVSPDERKAEELKGKSILRRG